MEKMIAYNIICYNEKGEIVDIEGEFSNLNEARESAAYIETTTPYICLVQKKPNYEKKVFEEKSEFDYESEHFLEKNPFFIEEKHYVCTVYGYYSFRNKVNNDIVCLYWSKKGE